MTTLSLSPAIRAAVQRGLGGVGAGAGAGALAGAGLGGLRGYHKAREEGAGVGEALLHGAGGAAHGASTGALVGGAGLGALEASGVAPGLYGRLGGMKGPIGAGARFGERQVHALTGWTPKGFFSPEGARQIGAGAADAAARLARDASPEARKAFDAAERAEGMGITSLPGFVRSVREHGLGKTMAAGAADQWHAGGRLGKALAVGVPAATVVGELGRKGPEAEGRTGRLLGAAGQVGAMSLGTLPIAGTLAVNAATRHVANAAGKLRGRGSEVGHNPAPPETSPAATGLTGPTERVYSDRATGEIPVLEGASR
jgi:hypothetical protein